VRPHQKKRALRWLITIAYAVGIFLLSSRAWSGVPTIPYIDKVVHLALYGGLGVLTFWSLQATLRGSLRRLLIVTLLACVAYGFSDEFHQAFVPGRSAEWADLLSDAVGAALGALVAMWALRGSATPHEEGERA
jgi:VanZ family protein